VQLNAEIQSVFKQGEVTIGEARIELIAEDPILYSQTLKTQDITFAAGSGVVANAGTAPVYPTVRIHGNVTNPSVANSSFGRTVSLSGVTIAAGNYYDLDMVEETVEDPSGTNKYNYVNSDDFFWLGKGNNTISLGGTLGGSGYRKVTLTYRDGYLGI
jgi:phage-related protein